MTYADIENSEYDGAPVELFKFVHDTDIWNYSSGSEEVTHDSETYEPVAIGLDSEISITSEPNKSDISVIMPIDLGVSQLFLTGSPEAVVSLTVFRLHEPSGVYEVYWKGRVSFPEWTDDGQTKFNCESIFSSIKRQGLRGRYTRGCRHALYSTACGPDKDDWAAACTVTAVSGSSISFTVDDSTSYDDGYFAAGMLYAAGAWRFITGHSSGVVTILGTVSGLAVDDAITLYAGCDHVLDTCNSKFSNGENHGGCPYISTDNPFQGSLI